MDRKQHSTLLLLVLGALVCLVSPAWAGGPGEEDLFGDLNQAQQQRPALDDADFLGVMQQEFVDFHDVSKHRKPSRQRIRTYPGSYRFYESHFDVYWDTLSFRSREAQGEGAALVTVMFADVVHFDPNRRRTGFSLNTFIGTALDHCRRNRPVHRGKGIYAEGGFSGYDSGPGARVEADFKGGTSSGSEFDFNLGIGTDDRYAWDERVGPGNGGYPGAYGDSRGWDFVDDPPVLIDDGDFTVFRRDKYVVGGYNGLYDFSRDRTDLVKNFLTRAAQDSRYERLYSNAYMAPDSTTAYRRIKQLLSTKRLPVLTLLPRQRDAVLVYRIVERSDGLGAMMYWRPSDSPNRRVDRETLNRNVIWAVPSGNVGYKFIDRAELENRRFRWGNPVTVLIVPNLCRVYEYFASYLSGGDLNDPGYRPSPPPVWDERIPYPQDQFPYPDQGYPPRRGKGDSGLDWSVDLMFRGLTDLWAKPPRNRPPRLPPPDRYFPPPRWEPMPPPIQDIPYYPPPNYNPPPPDRFRYRPTPKNPYCNKPVGQGRGKFVYIGFGYDETGYNQWGFDTEGLNREGFDPWGFDRQGYGRDGFDPWGYDRGGYDRRGFSLFNRARQFIDLVNQYHTNPFAFRMQFDIKENGSIVRIVDGAVVWNQGGAPVGTPGNPVVPPPVIAPPVPGPQKAAEPEFKPASIAGKIKGLAAPYEIQLDRNGRYHILKDGKRTAIPRNINVNSDFEMQFQDKSKDYIFIQSTPAPK
ncbi:MAG: hypothetical protein HYY25_03985 [Candidatus Wallbacteria bacterium]|nr:hypothetical protein [Candidatus Wallbacteria bacterium]